MATEEKSLFNKLYEANVNEHKEDKNGLSYLSWAWAWQQVKSRCPDATYTILRDDNGLPYFKDEDVGYMCMTEVTIEGETLMMWLPVMDFRNKAMMNPTMFDVNKTIMRCLTKNLGMFGLGLYIYAGEDLPQDDTSTISDEDAAIIKKMLEATNSDVKAFLKYFKVNSVEELRVRDLEKANKMLSAKQKGDKQ